MAIQALTIDGGEDRLPPGFPAAPAPELLPITCDRRSAAIDDLVAVLDATRALQAVLEANQRLCEASLTRLRSGDEPGRLHVGFDVAGTRLATADALAAYERARHSARGTLICAQAEGGMNMKEIGRVWGISRQLAHRFYKEPMRPLD